MSACDVRYRTYPKWGFALVSAMSGFGGRPDVARRWSELLLLANNGHAGAALAARYSRLAAAQIVAADARAAILLDHVGWHAARALEIPDNITLLPLPPRAPELNPAENVWQFMRYSWLSNRIVQS